MTSKPSNRATAIAASGIGGAVGACAFSGPVITGADVSTGLGLLLLGMAVGAVDGWLAADGLRRMPRSRWSWAAPLMLSLLIYLILPIALQMLMPRHPGTAPEAVGIPGLSLILGAALGSRISTRGGLALQVVGALTGIFGGISILLSLGNPADLVAWMMGGIALLIVGVGLFLAGTAARTKSSA